VARALGADEVVALPDGPGGLRDAVRALTGGRGVEVVYDAVGGALSVEALRACAFGARFVLVGWAGTPLVARGGRDPNALPTNLVLMKGVDVLGSPAAIAAHRDPALRAERLARVLGWAEALRPHVGRTFPLDEAAAALRAKWEGRVTGNVVVTP
jgi:NADPH2:quinone reductase